LPLRGIKDVLPKAKNVSNLTKIGVNLAANVAGDVANNLISDGLSTGVG
jgi:hypothetical protein